MAVYPETAGKSLKLIAVTTYCPIPFTAKIFSIITEPPSIAPKLFPINAITGKIAFFKA